MVNMTSPMCRGGLKDNWLYIISLFVFSCVFVLVYSTSTSPFYPYPDTSDSFIFQLIGKEWLSGSIPYKDLFDNNGPLLYALNALGYWLMSAKTGIAVVQTVFFFALAIVTFRFLGIGFGRRSSFWLTIVLLLGLSLGYDGGNNASEYAMPLIMYAFYIFYKWLEQDDQAKARISVGHHIIYGVALGVCLMIRVSNAFVMLLLVAYMFIHYLARRQFKAMIASVAAVTVGVLLVCLPFIIYFWSKNSLGDFYYAMVTSNLQYFKNSGVWASPMYLKRAIMLICGYSNCLAFIIVGLLLILKKTSKRRGFAWFAMGIICVIFFLKTNCYPNYAHICLPFAVIGLLELKNIIKDARSSQLLRTLSMAVLVFIIGVNFFNGAYTLVKNVTYDDSSQEELYKAYDSVLKKVPEEGLRSFANYECMPEILLRWNIHPSCRFFDIQGLYLLNYNPDEYEKAIDEFVHCDAQWVLVNIWKGLPREIDKMLKEGYVSEKMVFEDETKLMLYKKKGIKGTSD